MKKFSFVAVVMAALAMMSCNTSDQVVIRLEETALKLVKGETKQLTAVVLPEGESVEIEWFSSKPEYVSISETGVVKAEKMYFMNATDTEATPVSVYCKYNGGAAECKVTVLPLDVESIELEILDHDVKQGLILDPKETCEIKVNFYPENADIDYSKLEWKSSGFEFVSVKKITGTSKALITAEWAGNASITAVYANKLEVSVGVLVNVIEAESVQITDKTVTTLKVGDILQLDAEYLPANATVNIEWSIQEGSDCATIDEDGKLVATAPGKILVMVSAGRAQDYLEITIVDDSEKE